MAKHSALIVDDEPDILELLDMTLSRMGISSHKASCLSEAYTLLKTTPFDLCLTDMRLPDGQGIDLVKYTQKHFPELPVAIITAYGNTQTAIDSLKAGAFDFISKPVELDKLRKLIASTLELEKNTTDKALTHDILLGTSRAINDTKTMIHKLSRNQAPVHISGESGTGKELVAHLIHSHSPRRNKSFIPINCGAIPQDLMESELFGHLKGSFTGASRDKQGLFQAADGGTLFLDEVADLPLSMQVKLLRAIHEGAVRPVGSHHEEPIDIRILSATNKDLRDLTNKGKFRSDLYYRLNVIELHLSPLRERKEDINVLTDHIIQKHNLNTSPSYSISDQARQSLNNYSFPGNIRELENILERTLALCENSLIDLQDILLPSHEGSSHHPSNGNKYNTPSNQDGVPLEDYLAKIEKTEIASALERCQWNRVETAKILGLSLRQLRYRMNKLDFNG